MDRRPSIRGASIVEITILALLLVLIGHACGLPISVAHCAMAVILAAALYCLGSKLWK